MLGGEEENRTIFFFLLTLQMKIGSFSFFYTSFVSFKSLIGKKNTPLF